MQEDCGGADAAPVDLMIARERGSKRAREQGSEGAREQESEGVSLRGAGKLF
jgi:hypothetical protein